MKYLHLFIAAFVLWMSSCTPDPISVEIPVAPVLPTVAAQFYYDTITEQSALLIVLSKSFAPHLKRTVGVDSNGLAMDTGLLIGNAKVKVNIAGVTYLCEEAEKGFYYLWNISLSDFQSCILDVKDQWGNTLITAQTLAMPSIRFSSLYLSYHLGNRYLHYTIKGIPGKNWYLVNYLTQQKADTAVNYQDPAYIARQLTEQKLSFDLYTDADFTQGQLTVKKYLGNAGFDTVAVAVSRITETYFQFLKAQKNYGKFINQVKGEVVYFPSNIQGGYGFFSMHQPKVEVLVADDTN
ncbi:MAG: DUF4249 family protein [Bacteroidia bacterium]|jgi:hypothetical protein